MQEKINSNSNQELRILKFIKVGDYKSTLKELQYFGNLKSKYLIDLYEQIITGKNCIIVLYYNSSNRMDWRRI